MKQYKGKAVFINFWATWCKPCLEEMPSIAKAQRILENENVRARRTHDSQRDAGGTLLFI